MIHVYIVLHGGVDVSTLSRFKLRTGGVTRGRSLKLSKPQASCSARQNFFSVRVNDWNGLPDAVVNAPFLNAFKNGHSLGVHLVHHSCH